MRAAPPARHSDLLHRVALDDLVVEDERSYRHVGLYDPLKQIVRLSGYRFAVPTPGSAVSPSEALLLNLAYWSEASQGDVLTSDVLPADVLLHVAWHVVADHHLPRCTRGEILGEAVASAFDLYLVGRLLGHAGDADFLVTQVPRMTEAALEAGASEAEFEALLTRVAEDPDGAFETMRALLYETTCALMGASTVDEAARVLRDARERPLGCLLHHFELATWVQKARGKAQNPTGEDGERGAAVDRLHEELAARPDALAWLEVNWVIRRLDELSKHVGTSPREPR